MNGFSIRQGDQNDLDLVKPLWERLVHFHVDLSTHFKNRFENADWTKRKERLIRCCKDISLHYVVEEKRGNIVGYCISTIDKEDDKIGEVASIYVQQEYRGLGLGTQLMTKATEWLQSQGAQTQKLFVGAGNESVLDFYRRFGFVPWRIELQQVDR